MYGSVLEMGIILYREKSKLDGPNKKISKLDGFRIVPPKLDGPAGSDSSKNWEKETT